jgi:hypothetical protein
VPRIDFDELRTMAIQHWRDRKLARGKHRVTGGASEGTVRRWMRNYIRHWAT